MPARPGGRGSAASSALGGVDGPRASSGGRCSARGPRHSPRSRGPRRATSPCAIPRLSVSVVENGVDLDALRAARRGPRRRRRAAPRRRGRGRLRAQGRAARDPGGREDEGVPPAGRRGRRPRARCARSPRTTGHSTASRSLPPRADVEREFADADVVLSCSLYESFGLAVVEGAAAGCAVVCTDTGVGPELVADDDGAGAGRLRRAAQRVPHRRRARGARAPIASSAGRWARRPRRRAARFSWDEMARADPRALRRAREARAVRVLHVGLETTAARPGGLNRYLEAPGRRRARRRAWTRRGRPGRGADQRRGTRRCAGSLAAAPGARWRSRRSRSTARCAASRARPRGPALRRHRGAHRAVGVPARGSRRSCTSRGPGQRSPARAARAGPTSRSSA